MKCAYSAGSMAICIILISICTCRHPTSRVVCNVKSALLQRFTQQDFRCAQRDKQAPAACEWYQVCLHVLLVHAACKLEDASSACLLSSCSCGACTHAGGFGMQAASQSRGQTLPTCCTLMPSTICCQVLHSWLALSCLMSVRKVAEPDLYESGGVMHRCSAPGMVYHDRHLLHSAGLQPHLRCSLQSHDDALPAGDGSRSCLHAQILRSPTIDTSDSCKCMQAPSHKTGWHWQLYGQSG